MRYIVCVLLSVVVASCTGASPQIENAPVKSSKPIDDPRTAECVCTGDEFGSCLDGDVDGDCRCNGTDNCIGVPNCPQDNADGDAFGDVCDEMPNTPNPETTIAALDTRLDALEAAQSSITALQADVVLLVTALAEIRSKYPEHFHGLLGLNGDPVGTSGDLGYSLPGD